LARLPCPLQKLEQHEAIFSMSRDSKPDIENNHNTMKSSTSSPKFPKSPSNKEQDCLFQANKKINIKNNALVDSPISDRTSKIKFLDDQLYMEGKPVTPPSKKLASPKIIPSPCIESLAEKISHMYNKSGIIEFKQKLPDGFYALPFVSPLPSLEQLKLSESSPGHEASVLVLDQSHDHELHNLVINAQNLCSPVLNPIQRVKTLAVFVSNALGGRAHPNSSPALNSSFLYEKYCKQFSLQKTSSILYLGKLQYGLTHERALLFQYLAVRLSLSSKLITIAVPQSTGTQPNDTNFSKRAEKYHGYNVVQFENSTETFVVDLIYNPGSLYIDNSRLASQYKMPFDPLSFQELSHSLQHQNENTLSNNNICSMRWFDPSIFCVSEPEIIEQIGSGRTAKVFRVKLNGFLCALKIVKTEEMIEDMKQSLRREAKLMCHLSHRHVLSLLGHEERPKEFHMYMELMSTSLEQQLIEMRNGSKNPFTLSQVVAIAKAVAEALNYLHTLPHKVMHRDIKSKNVLLDITSQGELKNVKLSDFGVATKIRPGKEYQDAVGTPRWMAPECHLMQSYDEKVDIWSFGMLLFELTTFQVPYAETEFLDVKERIVKGELPDLSHILVHLQPLKKIILNCLQFQAKLRPTANELIEQLNHVNISQ